MTEKVYLIDVTLAVAVPESERYPDSYCFDAVNEILREQQRTFVKASCLLDYAIPEEPVETGVNAEKYFEGAFFLASRSLRREL